VPQASHGLHALSGLALSGHDPGSGEAGAHRPGRVGVTRRVFADRARVTPIPVTSSGEL
jgi:hypothetical protein